MSAGPLDPTPLVVGVDGGGSRTRVLLADANGTVLARVEGAASALKPGQESAAADVIKALIVEALASAERSETRPAVCVVGVAGAGQERAAQALWSAAHGAVILELDGRYPPGSDLDRTWAALAAAFGSALTSAAQQPTSPV